MQNLMVLSTHAIGDIGFYLCFVAGQYLFVLKRSASAIRNPNNTIRTRKQFFYVNWTPLLVRALVEAVLFYYPWRHIPLPTIVAWFHVALPGWAQTLIAGGMAGDPIAAGALGYVADSLLDGLSVSTKVPGWLSRWIKENIPPAPPASV